MLTIDQIKQMITAAAVQKGLDPGLALAVAETESSFNPNAKSGVGAMGLFQLMPKTAASYGVSNAFDPAQNINAGVSMLADLNRQYDGDLPSILAAYNWGSGNLASGAPLPTETQNYIAKISRILGVAVANPWRPRRATPTHRA
jgi:soluble lytic murein transglycosylase-like protein